MATTTMEPTATRTLPWGSTVLRNAAGDPYAAGAPGIIEGATARQALVTAGLNWDVEMTDLYGEPYVDDEGRTVRKSVLGRYGVTRSDTHDTLGIVSERYVPLDNRAVAEFTDLLVDTHESSLVGMGSTKGGVAPGTRVYSVVKLDDTIKPGGMPDEAVDVFLLVWNSFDGSQSFTASIVPYRLACLNGLRYPMKSHVMTWAVRHSSQMQQRIVAAREAIQKAAGYTTDLRVDMEELLKVPVSTGEAIDVMARVFPMPEPKTDKDGTVTNQRARDNAYDRQIVTLDLLKTSDNLGNIRDTGWGLVNAVAEWHEWGRKTRSEPMHRLLNAETVPAVVRAREAVLAL